MRRRFFLGLVLALALCTTTLSGAHAQGRRGGGRMMGGVALLRIPDVQKELKMTPEEIAKVDDKQTEVQQSMREVFQSGGGNPADMTPEERTKMMEKMQDIQTKAVNDILDATQQKRFHELELQQAGGGALTRKDVSDELKLTDDQKTKIADIQKQANTERQTAMQGVDFQNMSSEDRTKMMTKMQDMQKATNEKLIGVLTDDQKKQWKTMQGDPFTFPAMRMGGPGGGGGGRRRGGAGGGAGA